ncbi:MAG TPA: hypothetical protein PLO89_05605 [Spirochaetota bacterium]|nr:hypothetical protein [Spirochaetota bacterium]
MVNKKTLFFSIFYIILFINAPLIFSDESEDSKFIFKYSEDNKPLFIQKIFWKSSPYALKYQFLLKDSQDKIIIEKVLETNFLECSLHAGDYHYKIITYNILEQVEQESGWIPVKIEKAYLPTIFSMSIETLYVENYYGDPIVLTGKDFTDKVIVTLKDLSNPARRIITGEIKSKDNNKIVVQFKTEDLTPGKYEVIVTNPGNVYASKSFAVKYKKPVDFLLTGGYGPLLNSYTGDFNKLLLNICYPVSFQIDFVIFALKLKYGFVGFGLSSDITYFDDTKEISLYIIMIKNAITANYLYKFNKRFGILAKIGGGITITGLIFNYGSEDLNNNELEKKNNMKS